MATNQDPHHGDHMKLFAYAAETVRSHVSVSESLVAATYNNRPTAQVSLGDPHTDNRKLHSKYQAGIPKSVPVKPVPNDDLRIVDMIDGGQTHPFILREEQVSASKRNSAIGLYDMIRSGKPRSDLECIGPSDVDRTSFRNDAVLRRVNEETRLSMHNKVPIEKSSKFVCPVIGHPALPADSICVSPAVQIHLGSENVPRELLDTMSLILTPPAHGTRRKN